jgi:hypothetical protein
MLDIGWWMVDGGWWIRHHGDGSGSGIVIVRSRPNTRLPAPQINRSDVNRVRDARQMGRSRQTARPMPSAGGGSSGRGRLQQLRSPVIVPNRRGPVADRVFEGFFIPLC